MTEPPRVPVEDLGASRTRGAAGEVIVPTESDAGLGTRAHVRETLERLRVVLVDARTRRAGQGPTFALGEALAGTAASAWRAPPPVVAQLRESVRAYACRLRADGLPAERMLVLVKSAVREAIPREFDAVEAPALTAALVRDSIMAFYEVGSPA